MEGDVERMRGRDRELEGERNRKIQSYKEGEREEI